ncbi:hypothetical protein O181_103614 [Austropuccinia psidii MF-1]|uniref:Uncharacterized protein n=1 Tax=Austropuccinia psidii MF-1 TaxID=1389203 RepID=A0A9Q3PJE1_9BASI|nr:hypothetical protein [Austropuccinia psidii MF-1]
MPSTRSGEIFNTSSSSPKVYINDHGRSQSVAEEKESVKKSQTDKLCHSEADNTILPSNRTDTATRGLSGNLQSQPEVSGLVYDKGV